MDLSHPRTRVLVVYPYLMHYRRSVFLELDRSPELDVTFAAASGGQFGVEAMDPNELSRFIDTPSMRFRGVQWQGGVLRLALAGRYDCAVFFGDWASVTTWLAAAIFRIRRIRVLFWTIGWHRPEQGSRRLVRLMFYHLANALLLYGELGKRIGAQLGYPVERMHVIYNSVEAPSGLPSDELYRQIMPISRKLVVGAVIRLSPVKRLELLIEAAALLRENHPELVILLIGEGPMKLSLIETADRLGVTLITPGPAYSDEDLTRIYSVLDITVVPAAVGLTAIQSMSYGVPVISDDDPYTQMPEWEAILPGKTGGRFRRGDAADLAREISKWIERLEKDGSTIAQACREEVKQRWTASGQAKRLRGMISGRC